MSSVDSSVSQSGQSNLNRGGINPSSTSASGAGTGVGASKGDSILVQGQTAPSVNVQSQLATSTLDEGSALSSSNLSQVVSDLSKAHTAHAGWIESESAKLAEWGQREIDRILAATKAAEQRLVQQAQEKQKRIEEEHKVELAALVQTLDSNKAKRLKELEDSLQRDLQAALNNSKREISDIESKMNARKMELLSLSQAQTAKDVDKLSALAVTAKLHPSVTRTVIDTNTETGTIIAVAAGGEISTGSAQGEKVATKRVEAVPTSGTLAQQADIKTGDIVRNDNEAKVGQGAIVNTMTEVSQRPAMQDPAGGINKGVASDAGLVQGGSSVGQSGGIVGGGASNLGSSSSTSASADRVPNDYAGLGTVAGGGDKNLATAGAGTSTTSTTSGISGGTSGASIGGGHSDVVQPKKVDAAYGVPLTKTQAPVQKHSATDSDTHGKHESSGGGLLHKMKAAISGEPKSSESHSRRL